MVKDDQAAIALKLFGEAKKLFDTSPHWVAFHKQILGVEGIVRKEFAADIKQLVVFEQTNEYTQILHMAAQLRDQTSQQPTMDESPKVITVRLPTSMHEALVSESHENHISLNKLCIAKLLLPIDPKLLRPNTGKDR